MDRDTCAPVEASLARYCLNVCLRVKPAARAEFLRVIAANQTGTLNTEPLALKYNWGEDEQVTNVFHFHEQYKGREGFESHTKTPHFAAWEDFLKTDPLREPPEVDFYTEIGLEPTATASAADTTDAATFCVNSRMHLVPEVREDFLRDFETHQKRSLEIEPLLLSFVCGEDEKVPCTFHVHGEYKGREGWEAHLRTKHIMDLEKKFPFHCVSARGQTMFYFETA